jgi:hypothetical protein
MVLYLYSAGKAADRISTERTVGYRRAVVKIRHPTALRASRVITKRAVSYRRVAIIIAHPTALTPRVVGPVPTERAVSNPRVVIIKIVHPATCTIDTGGRVSNERAVGKALNPEPWATVPPVLTRDRV